MEFNSLGQSLTTAQYYNYDSTGRIQQSYQHTAKGEYTHYEMLHYDAAANLLDSNQGQGYVKYNRVYVYQDKRYHYDRFGRLAEKRISGHTIQHFKYDAEHRIIEIKHTQHAQTKYIRFKYDPLGRRIEKATYLEQNAKQPISKTEFHWQGMRLLKEIQNGLSNLYVYKNLLSYEPLARIEGEPNKEKISYFHTNLAGLPEQLTDQIGNTVWQAEYELWGNTRQEWKDTKTNFEQNLRYQGQYLDRETGLHYNTFRYYDPDIGRFTQPDPIGLLGGYNLYQYAPNPINWIDPWGLWGTGMNGANATIDNGSEVVISTSNSTAHAEINGLNSLLKTGGLNGKDVVIRDVEGMFSGGTTKPVALCTKCRANVMDPLIYGNAKSLTITKTVGNKELYNITIQNGDFATVRDQINAIINDPTIKSNRERSDKAWDVLERNGTKSPCPK